MGTITINTIIKRDGTQQAFDVNKIIQAIDKALNATDTGTQKDAKKVADAVHKKLITICAQAGKKGNTRGLCKNGKPTVEEIQDVVEETLMESQFHEAAKAYIIYRNEKAKERRRDIFKRRIYVKPVEYPELLEYVDAIRHSYWIHTEFNFTSDVQDFLVLVSDAERNAIKNALLAIAQIEVSVKTFWGDIYKKLPKPEIGSVGYTFAESEVRHQDAYAHLLDILGLNSEFEKIRDFPAIQDRISYLEKALKDARSEDNQEYARTVLLFSLFIEHVSLFSQFLVIMSFNKFKNLFKGTSNVVEATSKEEQIHGLFGIDIIKIIMEEHPEWFDESYEASVIEACREAYEAECKIIDWIFEKGELEFMTKDTVKEFIKNRFNNSLASIGYKRIFEINDRLLGETEWFDTEIIGTKHVDFFVKRSINYNKRAASVTSADLF